VKTNFDYFDSGVILAKAIFGLRLCLGLRIGYKVWFERAAVSTAAAVAVGSFFGAAAIHAMIDPFVSRYPGHYPRHPIGQRYDH
jgi:hypothetical protein